MSEKNKVNLLDELPKMAEEIIIALLGWYNSNKQRFYDGYYTFSDYDNENTFIMQCEAVSTILMLCRNFENCRNLILNNPKHKECISRTINSILETFSKNETNAGPYLDVELKTFKNSKYLEEIKSSSFLETLYMAGTALFYAGEVFGDDDVILDYDITEKIFNILPGVVGKIRRSHLDKVSDDVEWTGWTFCDKETAKAIFNNNDLYLLRSLYFTYNTISFITLIDGAKQEELKNSINLSKIFENFSNIKSWLLKDFLFGDKIDMENKDVDINTLIGYAYRDDSDYRIYNNFYIINSILLLRSEKIELNAEEISKLFGAINFASNKVINGFDDLFKFSKNSGYPKYTFPLFDIKEGSEAEIEVINYDDRSIHALTLTALSLFAQETVSGGKLKDNEIEDLIDRIVKVYNELLKIRAKTEGNTSLWDSINDPSIYYTMRAVDAMTELYRFAQKAAEHPNKYIIEVDSYVVDSKESLIPDIGTGIKDIVRREIEENYSLIKDGSPFVKNIEENIKKICSTFAEEMKNAFGEKSEEQVREITRQINGEQIKKEVEKVSHELIVKLVTDTIEGLFPEDLLPKNLEKRIKNLEEKSSKELPKTKKIKKGPDGMAKS